MTDELKKTRVLIDTNILIPAEDTNKKLDPVLAKMLRWSAQYGYVLYVHPDQKQEIQRDGEAERRDILLSRIGRYPLIDSPPELTDAKRERLGWRKKNKNDRVDNLLLYALLQGAVDFLITEDREIHKKAQKVGVEVEESVHLIAQFRNYLESLHQEKPQLPGGIQEYPLYKFDVEQTFFDSLREGYENFDEWYQAKKKDRKAWGIAENGTLHAICIYKHEEGEPINDQGTVLDGPALKLCTFKVGEEVQGRKIGERLLYTAFRHAADKKIHYIYLHISDKKQGMLVSLCKNFGFERCGTYKKRDHVYVKTMRPPTVLDNALNSLEYAIRYYPSYLDGPLIKKYIVPIEPQFHKNLFPDLDPELYQDDPNQYSSQSNTIKKAYICHANIKKIDPGSLLLFYRSRDRQSIGCIGAVEQTYRSQNINKVLPLVSKRTVYSKKEIEGFMQKDTLVILFRFIGGIPSVNLRNLMRAGMKGPPQSIQKIKHELYEKCFRTGSA